MKAKLLIMGLHVTLTFLMPLVPEQSREALMQSGWRLFKGLTLGRGIPYAAPPVNELPWKAPQPHEAFQSPQRSASPSFHQARHLPCTDCC